MNELYEQFKDFMVNLNEKCVHVNCKDCKFSTLVRVDPDVTMCDMLARIERKIK